MTASTLNSLANTISSRGNIGLRASIIEWNASSTSSAGNIGMTASSIYLSGDVISTGNQTYAGNLSVFGSLTADGNIVAHVADGRISVSDGDISANSVDLTASSITLRANVHSKGDQVFNGAVFLDLVFNNSPLSFVSDAGNIVFNGTLDLNPPGLSSLSSASKLVSVPGDVRPFGGVGAKPDFIASAPRGNIVFNGDVGSIEPLLSLTADAINIKLQNVKTEKDQSYATSGFLQLHPTATREGNSSLTLESAGGDISF